MDNIILINKADLAKGSFTRPITEADFALRQCLFQNKNSFYFLGNLTWAQCYKTFSVRNLQIFVMS